MNKKFWNWKNPVNLDENESEERVLEINGVIAEDSWFDDDVTPELFKEELLAGNGPVTVWINSPGGDCIAGSRIYSMLCDYKQSKGKVTVKVDGLAGSAASVIAMAGDEIQMAATALMMIHNPLMNTYGNAKEHLNSIKVLEEVKESIINAYEIKTKLSRNKISHLMDEETWMNARKAMELGFADGLLKDKSPVSDMAAYSYSGKRQSEKLMNLIKDVVAAAEENETVEETPAVEEKPIQKEVPKGRKIDDLLDRLNLLKF